MLKRWLLEIIHPYNPLKREVAQFTNKMGTVVTSNGTKINGKIKFVSYHGGVVINADKTKYFIPQPRSIAVKMADLKQTEKDLETVDVSALQD